MVRVTFIRIFISFLLFPGILRQNFPVKLNQPKMMSMEKILSRSYFIFRLFMLCSVLTIATQEIAEAQTCGFTNFQFQRITANIHPLVKGYLWKKPSDYDTNPSKYYATIIYWHGVGSVGNGSTSQLCNIVQHPFGGNPDDALPIQIQNGQATLTVTSGGQTYEYMVFCPQYTQYSYSPGTNDVQYPSAGTAAATLQYLMDNYRIDPKRVYMTGMSTGANIVMEYAAASTANASKLAAITPVSLCAINVIGAGNISSTNLPVWINHCNNDTRCVKSISEAWQTAINAGSPGTPAKLTLMNNDGVACNAVDAHNAWSSAYKSSYVVDGLNMFNWMIQFQRATTVPVVMKEYNVRLSNKKVFVEWSTSREIGAEGYIVERAGSDQKFQAIGKIAATANPSNLNQYSFIDNSPLQGLNFYRLVQYDVDQRKTYFDIRRVMESSSNRYKVVVYPNPIRSEVTAFINPSRPQQVVIQITNLSGQVIRTKAAFYKEGNTGVTFALDDIPAGVYFLRVSGADFSDVQKLVKQ